MNRPPADPTAKLRPAAIVVQESQMDCQLLATAVERQCRLRVRAAFTNSANVTEAVQQIRPDLILISPRLQDGPYAGLELAQRLRSLAITPKILMLLDTDERELVVESFRCGARGVFTRDESPQQLCRSIAAVLRGGIWASNAQLGYVMDALAEMPRSAHFNPVGLRFLTKRENEVLRLIATGFNNREIGDHLKLNENTIKNYVSVIFQKLGVSTRIELILHCLSERRRKAPQQIETGNEFDSSARYGT